MKDNYQIPILNNLRGIAALSVCLFHFICTTIDYISNKNILSFFQYGHYGVELFFIISGIVIPLSLLKSNYSLKKFHVFFLKRVIRIEPPYIAALIFSVLIIILKGNIYTINITQILLHIGYLIPFFINKYSWLNQVFWTLAIEFQYYIIISVLILLVITPNLFKRILFYLILSLLPFLLPNRAFFPYYSPIFLLGISWCLLFLNKIKSLEFIIIFTASLTITYFKIAHFDAYLGLTTILLIHFFKNYSNKLLLFFGNISYTFYLIHPLIGASCINLLSHKYRLVWQKPIVIIVGFIITTISSYIIYKLVEKPTHQLSKKIKY